MKLIYNYKSGGARHRGHDHFTHSESPKARKSFTNKLHQRELKESGHPIEQSGGTIAYAPTKI